MRQRLEELCAELAPVFDREELPPEELAARRVQREVARVRVGEHGRVRGRERVSRLDLAAFEARVAAVVVGERADQANVLLKDPNNPGYEVPTVETV